MNKILLSTYLIRITDKKKNDQILSMFNGKDDFFKTFVEFLQSIFTEIKNTTSAKETSALYLTLEDQPTIDEENRCIYGYFESGVGGEKYKIKDTNNNNPLMEVEGHHAAFRNIFFYAEFPKMKDTAVIVLQRKAKFGIKTILSKILINYFNGLGYEDYRLVISNIIHGKVYNKMMKYGSLKKVEFIKRRLPSSIEAYYKNDGNPEKVKGTLKTSMVSPSGLPSNYKHFVDTIFNNHKNETIEIEGIDEEFDEVEFELELNGKKKTFYVANRSKIQPDIDVTEDVEMDEFGEPTLESLTTQSRELIKDIYEIRP